MFLSWIRHHGRSAALAEALGLQAVWLPREGRVLGAYARNAAWTVHEIRRTRPGVIGIMLPPLPVLLAVLLARPRRVKIVADLHTGVFLNPRWRWCLRLTLRLLSRGHCAVVTNEDLARVCRQAGVHTFVLHDLLEVDADRDVPAAPTAGRRQVVVPLSYANDEPVAEILRAAELAPEVTFLLTGGAPEGLRTGGPQNVDFTGYLDLPSYASLLSSSDAVLALTTRDLTMQRAGYEGLQAGVPVVTSAFDTLRDYFGPAAVYTEAEAGAIAEAIRTALQANGALRAEGRERRRQLMTEQAAALAELRSWVDARTGGLAA